MCAMLRAVAVVSVLLAALSLANPGCCHDHAQDQPHDGHDHGHEGGCSSHDHAHDEADSSHDHDHKGTCCNHNHAQTLATHDHDHHAHSAHSHDHGTESMVQSSTDYLIVFTSGASVPLMSFLGNLGCRYLKQSVTKFLPVLVSFGAGTMLASAAIHFIPEAAIDTDLGDDPHRGAFLRIGLPILIGMLVSIVMEFVIHTLGGHHHDHDDNGFADVEAAKAKQSSEMQAMAWNMLIADAIHNTIDGVMIGTTFAKGMYEGFIATLLIILHELPQEIAELCVLLHAGWPMRKAIMRNCLSTLTIFIGIAIGLVLAQQFKIVQTYCIAFIAGEFLYVSLGQLIPSLAKTVMTRRQLLCSHVGFVSGIIFISLLTYHLPHAHSHDHSSHSHSHGHGH